MKERHYHRFRFLDESHFSKSGWNPVRCEQLQKPSHDGAPPHSDRL
jgi:hypothetical protein